MNWTLGILMVLICALMELGVYFQGKSHVGYWIANGTATALLIIVLMLLRRHGRDFSPTRLTLNPV